jgi:ribonucleoside-diphosphate reductase alpha chain
MTRTRLPNRRPHQIAVVEHNGFKLIVGIGRFDDGRVGELFIDTCKGGTALDTILRDSAILTSLALQAGIAASTIRAAVTNNGPIAAVLDRIGEGVR